MAKPLYAFWDGKDFEGIVWETQVGKIITMHGDLNPQMGFTVRDIETGENLESKDMVDTLIEILPKKIKDLNLG